MQLRLTRRWTIAFAETLHRCCPECSFGHLLFRRNVGRSSFTFTLVELELIFRERKVARRYFIIYAFVSFAWVCFFFKMDGIFWTSLRNSLSKLGHARTRFLSPFLLRYRSDMSAFIPFFLFPPLWYPKKRISIVQRAVVQKHSCRRLIYWPPSGMVYSFTLVSSSAAIIRMSQGAPVLSAWCRTLLNVKLVPKQRSSTHVVSFNGRLLRRSLHKLSVMLREESKSAQQHSPGKSLSVGRSLWSA